MTTRTHSKSSRLVRLAVTTALATGALTACTGKVAPSANYSAAQAETALAKGKVSKAVEHAEAAVLAIPRDAAARTLLANAYLEAGRFQSAATTYAEAIELGDTAPRTIISHALALTAVGDQAGALAILARFEAAIDPADYGLAVALAGRPEQGVHVLGNALRGGMNTPKVRQNLAYAFALQGNWTNARVMAAEDVPADQVGDRIALWSQLARPEMALARVSSLLAVTPAADPGQPAMLALANHNSVEQLAAEVAAPAPAVADQTPAFAMATELPAIDAAPAVFETAFADRGEAALADAGLAAHDGVTRFVSSPMVQDVPAGYASRVAATAQRAPSQVSVPLALAKGNYNIQLGSYFSMSDAQAAWKQFQSRYPELGDAERLITKARVNGKIYYRVAAAGFAQGSARAMCSAVKGKGGGCIAYAANRPLPGALRNNEVRVAAR